MVCFNLTTKGNYHGYSTALLDVFMCSQSIDLMIYCQDAYGICYIDVIHYLGMIKHISDEVMVMHDGAVIECSDATKVLGALLHE